MATTLRQKSNLTGSRNLERGRAVGWHLAHRRAIAQPDPIRYRAAAPGFAIKQLDAETRALIDMALATQPRAGRRVPV
jgi:hypothetical protein